MDGRSRLCAVAAGVGTMNTRFGALDVVRVVRARHARLVAGLFELNQFVAHLSAGHGALGECAKRSGQGGSGNDIARLKVGQFCFHSAGSTRSSPAKVQVPDCLSNKRLFDEHEILVRPGGHAA